MQGRKGIQQLAKLLSEYLSFSERGLRFRPSEVSCRCPPDSALRLPRGVHHSNDSTRARRHLWSSKSVIENTGRRTGERPIQPLARSLQPKHFPALVQS